MSIPSRVLTVLLLMAGAGQSNLPAQSSVAKPSPTPFQSRGPIVADVWNFATTPGEDEVDGFRSTLLVFKRNDGRVGMVAPAGWNSVGGSGELVLVNPALPSARISLRKSGLAVPKEFDAEWSNTIRDLLLAAVPKSAKNGKIVALKNQPFNQTLWKTFEGQLSFDLGGEKYIWSYIFLRIHDLSMIEAIAVSRESDFPKVRAETMAFLPTWRTIREQKSGR